MYTRTIARENEEKKAYKRSIARNNLEYKVNMADTALSYGVTLSYVSDAVKEYKGMRNRASAKKAGTAFETAIAKYLAAYLDKPIERRAKTGAKDRGDIAGVTTYYNKPVVVECKNEQRMRISTYLNEAEIEKNNADAYASFVAIKRKGVGIGDSQSIGRQCAIMRLSDLFTLANCSVWNDKNVRYGTDGMTVGIDEIYTSSKYDVEGALDIVEMQDQDNIHVVIHDQKGKGNFVVTTIENIAKMLAYQPK